MGLALKIESFAIPGDKITKYLLSVDHPDGGPKARFFLQFGFSKDRTTEFADALFHQALGAAAGSVAPGFQGRRRIACIGPILTPSGARPWVRTVWEIDHDEIGYFVTAFPDRDRDL